MLLSFTEENYLKSLYKIGMDNSSQEAGTNELAASLDVKPASVSDMLKKLKEKELVDYEKYGKIKLTDTGKKRAVDIIRKHRLWETFLYEKLEFTWDEVHEVAEELEHINSKKLIGKLDKFLGYPEFDPHGDPIPTEDGTIKNRSKTTLAEMAVGTLCRMVAVKDNSRPFLQYVMSLGLGLNDKIRVHSRAHFDGLTEVEIDGEIRAVSQKFAENIYVTPAAGSGEGSSAKK